MYAKSTAMKNAVILMILDGWGIGQENQANPIYATHPPTIEYIKNNYPSGSLQASGIAVGLPWGEEGNSEVGHLTMGVGKVIYQHYPYITLAIREGRFFTNPTILAALDHVKQNHSKINLVGLIGEGNIHSSREHVEALIQMVRQYGVDFAIHAITDGRDGRPSSAMEFLAKLPAENLASVMGRFYGMDRDRHWNFTQQAYQTMVGQGPSLALSQLQEHIQRTYDKDLNDEYITPVTIEGGVRAIKDGDAVFFFNFREDRMRQIVESFVTPSFAEFPTAPFKNLFVASMTQVRGDLNMPVAFPPQNIGTSLGKILSENDKSQLRVAETQKYAHVTFFFNGLVDKAYPNEYRILIPSRTVPRQDQDPEMMAPTITTRLTQAIEEHTFDFILVNYANPDMVAHTGNYEACKKAVAIIDRELNHVIRSVLETDATLLVTADHGNIERVANPLTGEPETKHDISPVPVYLVGKRYFRPQNPAAVREHEHATMGMLADIPPTILELFGIPQPPDMTGTSLLRQFMTQF